MNDVLDRVRAFVSSHVDAPFTDQQDLFETGLVSSLFAVQFVMWIERTFHTPMSSDDLHLANFSSVEAAAQFVADRRQALTAPERRS